MKNDTLEELIKGIRDLKVEMTELKKFQMVSSSRIVERSKGFVERCMWCDNPNHKRGDCDSYKAAIKDGIIYFKEGRIRLTGSDEPLKTNFEKGGMKKLIEDQTLKSNAIKRKEVEAYSITIEQKAVKANSSPSTEAMIRGAEAIRKITRWDDPVDIISIKAFLCKDKHEDDLYDAMVEEKRSRALCEEDVGESASKRRSPRNKEAQEEQNLENMPSSTRLGNTPLPKEWWEKDKMKEKDDSNKAKGKIPTYKLQSNIESSTDMKSILEEKILDAKIEFTLREALSIAKKDFYELIINVIKRKRQMITKAIMVEALDTRKNLFQEMFIEHGKAFALNPDEIGCVDPNFIAPMVWREWML
uniref:Predicted protein n=1 Tax=Physcomitrium patens TaxID=3218 RepID=A9U642_PHYPA